MGCLSWKLSLVLMQMLDRRLPECFSRLEELSEDFEAFDMHRSTRLEEQAASDSL